MTTIVYRDDILVGDSFQVIFTGENAIPKHSSKVFLNEDKTMAYAYCGTYPSKRFDVANHLISTIANWINDKPLTYINNLIFYAIVMYKPKDSTYVVANDDGKCKVIRVEEDDYFAYGTGGSIATNILIEGGSALEAIEEAMYYDTSSAGNINAVRRSTLRKL